MMNNNEGREQSIDPKLIEKLSLIGATPDRDPNMAAYGRERFLTELEGLPAAGTSATPGWLTGLLKLGKPGGNSVRIFNQKFALSTLLALIVVVVMLFGGASATAYASQSALPGDALYPIKMGLEQTQISLANDDYVQAQLYLEFAQRRMDEITKLLLQGRSSDVEFASNEFEYYIQQALDSTQAVIAIDPERGAELTNLVSQALLDYAIALKSVLLDAPDPVKPVVEKALLISQDGAGDESEIFGVVESISDDEIFIDGEVYLINDLTEFEDMIVVGDTVKVHVILTPEGKMIVREIELASDLNDDNLPRFGDDNNNNNDGPFSDEDDNSNDDDGNDNDSDDNENESEDNENDNESNENDNEGDSDDNLNENEAEDDEIDTKSEDDKYENKSDDNENHSEENDNEDKSEEDNNENNNEPEEEEEDNENGD